MITAIAGLALLVAVVVTSAVAVRRRLRYETWYFVHLYAYLAVALAFSHQLATGTDFVAPPGARAYWYALYVVDARRARRVPARAAARAAACSCTGCASSASSRRRPASCRSRSAAGGWTGCGRGPGSSSPGAS